MAFAETCAKQVEASSASWMLRTGEGAAQRPAARLWHVRLAFAVAAHLMTDSDLASRPRWYNQAMKPGARR